MKQKLIEFLEELNKAPEYVEVKISSKNYDAEHVIEAAIIAPLAARKLLEAVELLERVKNDAWFNHLGYEIPREIKRFLEDFNDENQGL